MSSPTVIRGSYFFMSFTSVGLYRFGTLILAEFLFTASRPAFYEGRCCKSRIDFINNPKECSDEKFKKYCCERF